MDDLIHPDQMTFSDAVGKHQRTGQSPTSRAAAVEAVPLTGSKRAAVYECIQRLGGATDEQIQIVLGMNPSTQRPRRVELVDQGLIKDSGRMEPTRSGRKAVVWVVA